MPTRQRIRGMIETLAASTRRLRADGTTSNTNRRELPWGGLIELSGQRIGQDLPRIDGLCRDHIP